MRFSEAHFYYNAILSAMPDAVSVCKPDVRGTNSRIFIVTNSAGDRRVFRFNTRPVAHRNHDIGLVLAAHGINAPRVQLHLYKGQYFESYPYIGGKSMAEAISGNLSQGQILDMYAGIATKMRELSEIPLRDFETIGNKDCHAVAKSNFMNKRPSPILGTIVKWGTQILNIGDKSVCHCDLTPGNIMMDKDNNISAILDLNAISIANINFSAAITGNALAKYQLSPDDFYGVCHDVMPYEINQKKIKLASAVLNFYFPRYIHIQQK